MTVLDSGDADVSTNYEIVTESLFGMPVNWLEGPAAIGTATISVGFASADQIEPDIRDKLCRMAAHAYEYREIMLPTNVQPDALWLPQIMLPYWMPRL